jgi:hypothetical protein
VLRSTDLEAGNDMSKKDRRRNRSAKRKKGSEHNPHGQTLERWQPSFEIQKVDDIEIAVATRNADDEVPKEGNRNITALSEMAARRFAADGRGSFVVVSESAPKAAVYLPMSKLAECIDALIPEASSAVKSAVANYDPNTQFVMINVFNRRRIAITIDGMRSAV